MKILHISNFGQKHNGRLYWNQCYKISNGFIRNGHNVYNFSERDVSRSDLLNKFNSNSKLQVAILDTVKQYNPDLVILGHADRINHETIEKIRLTNNKIKIIEWNVDNFYLDNTKDKLSSRSQYLDGIFTTTADEITSECIKNNFITFFPNIVDVSIENLKIFEETDHDNDLFFAISHGVGTGKLRIKNSKNEKNDPRVIFANNILDSRKLKCNFFGFNNVQPVWASELDDKISSCFMGLCLQRKPQLKYCLSDRVAQYGGNGLMLFIERDTEYHEFLEEDTDAVYFDDIDEFLKKADYLRSNKKEALSIAKSGYTKLHKFTNERVVADYFLDCTFKNNVNAIEDKYGWPIHFYK